VDVRRKLGAWVKVVGAVGDSGTAPKDYSLIDPVWDELGG